MLRKYPGVSIVGVMAMAIGIALGAGYLQAVNDFLRPELPLDEGERIVGLRNWDVEENDPELKAIHDFTLWRAQLESVENLSAFRDIERNVGSDAIAGVPSLGAEITPAAFRVARVSALMGRTLNDDDERRGAPATVVLGHTLWQNRFRGDVDIVGKTVRIGSARATVVGVMPAGFAFPVNHEFWTPLRIDAYKYGPRQGPAIQVFGRLADGVSMTQAQAELAALGARVASAQPATHAHLKPYVMKYTELYFGGQGSGAGTMYMVVLLFVILLLVLASNVATMIFARTATRETEIAVRYSLGASRGQLLLQFFIESFVLAIVATIVGLAVVGWGTGAVNRFFWLQSETARPFWTDTTLDLSTIFYALVLAVAGSVVAGVLPAFKVTGATLQSRIRHAAGNGDGGLRFGGMWGAVIVVQVVFAVLLVPPAIVAISSWTAPQRADAGFATNEYLSARLALDFDPPTDSVQAAAMLVEFETARQELRRRLQSLPGVSHVTYANALPGMDHAQRYIEVEATEGIESDAAFVMSSSVDTDFFKAFDARFIAGRAFNNSDIQDAAHSVIVNEDFAASMFKGRSALGRRVRFYHDEDGPWFEIVGVVRNLGMDTDIDPFHSGTGPGVYFPLTPARLGSRGHYETRIAFHTRGDAASFAPALRDVARAAHADLRLYDVLPLDRPIDRNNRNQRVYTRVFTTITAFFAVVALVISMAGIYSVMAFTVSRQTREIGIRIALGANRSRIVRGVFSRAMVQIGIGLVIGTATWFYVIVGVLGGGDRIGLFISVAAVLAAVGTVACGVPIRRALRVEPIVALREG